MMFYLFNVSYPVFYVLKRSLVGDVIDKHYTLFTIKCKTSTAYQHFKTLQVKKNLNKIYQQIFIEDISRRIVC